jgi:membrane associated rhomboid family serine protease
MSATEPDLDDDLDWRCYRHPDRSAGVKCRRCERAICPDCMITAPVGFQCRSCVKAGPPVRTLRSLRRDPVVTYGIIGVNLAVAVLTYAMPRLLGDFELAGVAVAKGDWWRIITGGFLHEGVLHVGMNMFLLLQLGQLLEPVLGRARFAALYGASLFAGALGVLLLTDPQVGTVGASGAVFGLIAAGVLALRRRGISPMQSGLGWLLAINLVLTFAVPNISIGGHLGGLIGGGIAVSVLHAVEDRPWLGTALVSALGVAFAAASLLVAANRV